MRIARVESVDGLVVQVEQRDDGLYRVDADPVSGRWQRTEEQVEPVAWHPPVEPTALLCIGKNYSEHAREFDGELPDYPILFMKNPAAATGHEQAIRLPAVCDDEVDYEGELAVVIGTACRNVSESEALNYVAGYTIANDVSARVWQKHKGGGQWVRGKSFDTFAPLGPVMVTADALTDWAGLHVRTVLNGQVVQDGATADMIFGVPRLISFLSQDTTLLPGTVLLTGTPEGVGWARDPKLTLKPGDRVEITIDPIGTLSNSVTAVTD